MKLLHAYTSSLALVAAAASLSGCSPAFNMANDATDGDVAAVKADLAKTPVDASDNGETALGFAAANGRLAVVQLLLAAGAKADASDPEDGMTPLMMAASGKETDADRDYPGVVATLIAAGAKVNARDKLDDTPLGHAAMGAYPRVVSLLVAAGAVVNDSGTAGMTPLVSAAWDGNLPMMQALIDAGADLNSGGSGAFTPLEAAATKDQLAAATLLIKAGADLNEASQRETPLDAAAFNGNIAIVQALLDAGADVNGKGDGPDTPLTMARDAHHDDVASLLVQHGGHV